jgi:hypothetical protein
MSSTCFEPEGLSSGRPLNMQLWCGMFCMYQYKRYRTHSFTYKTTNTDTCKTHYTISVHTTVFLKTNPLVRNM